MKTHVALCMFLVGCVADPPSLGESEHAIKMQPGDGDGCPDWGCGSNSPVIAATEFWDLAETFNVPNAQGFMITRFYRKSASGSTLDSRPDVINGELVAKRLGTDIISFRGFAVQGYVFDIVNVNTGAEYELYVASVGQTEFWAQPTTYFGAPPWTYTYNFTWRFPNQPPPSGTTVNPGIPICGVNTENDGVASYTAVLFDDDHIDAKKKRVNTERPNWFNIGCAAHALAKLHLTGNTKAAASRLGWTSTLAQRTAHLKMFSGDYCGNGTVFTVAGQPLLWKAAYFDSTNDVSSTIFFKQTEALWNQFGAICLNKPRVEFRPTPLGDATFPDGVEPEMEIGAGWCTTRNPRPPPCTGAPQESIGASVVSVNYRSRLIPMPQ